MSLLDLGCDLLVAVADAARGQTRRRFEHSVHIQAPREVVWAMLKSRDIVFEGVVPLRVVAETLAGRPGLERVHILAGSTQFVMLTRIVDERPGQAILYELLPQGTDPALVEGDDDYIGFVLQDTTTGTRLDLTRETSPRKAISRLTVPMGLRSGARRYKRKAEAMAHDTKASGPEARAG